MTSKGLCCPTWLHRGSSKQVLISDSLTSCSCFGFWASTELRAIHVSRGASFPAHGLDSQLCRLLTGAVQGEPQALLAILESRN